jgi:hypothetical protein
VPSVSVRVKVRRLTLLLSPLNHSVAPATLVSVAPFWLSASSLVRYVMIKRSLGPIVPAAVRIVSVSSQAGAPL